jgi:hypothetical protein
MAIRTLAVAAFTTEAVADTTNQTDDKHYNLRGGSSTQYNKIKEIYAGGLESSTSAPQKLLLARVSQIGTGSLTVVAGTSDAADDPNTAALAAPAVFYTASATNKCQRLVATSGSYLANIAFNALGGLSRLRFPFGEEPALLGNAANNGEVVVSGYTGTTAGFIGSYLKYETLALFLAAGLSLLA